MSPAPAEIDRNKFDEWCWRRGIELREAALALGCSAEQVRLMRLPFGHERRRVPNQELMARIVAWTEGAVCAADFYPPHMRGGQPVNDDTAGFRPTGSQP